MNFAANVLPLRRRFVVRRKRIFNLLLLLNLNLLLCVWGISLMLEFTRAPAIQLTGELSQDVSCLWYALGKIALAKQKNNESMCILIKAKWRRNLDKETRNLFYHFQALFWKMIHMFPCLALKNLYCGEKYLKNNKPQHEELLSFNIEIVFAANWYDSS